MNSVSFFTLVAGKHRPRAGYTIGLAILLGWQWGGLAGVAWGVLASRVVVVAQDLYVVRLIGGGGWLSLRTWQHLLIQCGVGAALYFAASALSHTAQSEIPPETFWQTLSAIRWQLLLAIVHAGWWRPGCCVSRCCACFGRASEMSIIFFLNRLGFGGTERVACRLAWCRCGTCRRNITPG